MERTTITFYDETYHKLQERANRNRQSIALCVRELVELGLKVEAAADNATAKNDMKEMIDDLKNLLTINMNWSLESRLIGRFLVASHSDIDKEKQAEVLEKYPDRAEQYVKKVINEQI